ncbi:hypothetical protein VMCG_01835 [Cytospora schulzeri]|uniref:Lysophospholipase n=1 Tax=Cytospora schulzeri TaxID=448051 RepID=A0A423X2R6_9PEZI|nr:hypothetical protein VMCG_01835 [Valsa malicola]
MLSLLFLSLAPASALAASSYTPVPEACPSSPLVRSADGMSDSEATWITGRKAVADAALETWLATALPTVDTSSLPTLALSISGGGFRSLLTGAGVIQALDGRDSSLSTAGLYQALTYHAGLSGGAWLLSAIAAENWPTISSLRDDVWETQLAGGILNSSSATTVNDYVEIASDIMSKANAGFPVSLTDPWGRMLSYQVMLESDGAVDVTMSDIASLSNFTSYNAPFPIITASKITYSNGECAPQTDEAIYEFNPYEFGSWSDDISAFVQSEYLGSNISAGSASECVTGFDKIDWVLGSSSMLLNEYICNTSLGFDITSMFPSSIVAVVEEYTPDPDYGYALVPNPFKGYNSTTATETSSVSDLDDLYIVDGGESSRNVPILPLLEPTRNVSVLIINDNSADTDEAFPNGMSLVLAYEESQTGRLAGRFPAVPAAGEFSTARAQFFGCDDADAVTVIYLPNSDWTYASNTTTLQLTYTADETDSMISNGNQIAAQGGDEYWGACLACGIMLKEVGGAFMFGTKESPLMPTRLLSKGYAIASLDYRLSGDAVFPASVEDCKSAVRWLRAHAGEYGLDADRFVAFGESAGGHQASMLGVTTPADGFDVGDHLDVSSAVQGVVPYYGPSDFLQMDAQAPQDGKSQRHDPPESPESLYIGAPDGIQAVPEKTARANPITYISAGKKVPPFFISHGVDDHLVPYHQSVVLDEALKKAGAPVKFYPVEGADHLFSGMTKEQSDELDRKTDEFLASVLGS